MKARDAMIAWTPVYATWRWSTIGQIRIAPLDGADDDKWTKRYAFKQGGMPAEMAGPQNTNAALRLFRAFNTIVVRDGITPEAAHQAFLTIDEYAESIAADTPGAR